MDYCLWFHPNHERIFLKCLPRMKEQCTADACLFIIIHAGAVSKFTNESLTSFKNKEKHKTPRKWVFFLCFSFSPPSKCRRSPLKKDTPSPQADPPTLEMNAIKRAVNTAHCVFCKVEKLLSK